MWRAKIARFQNPPYLTKRMSIREYSHFGDFSQFIWIIFVFVNDGVLNLPNVSTPADGWNVVILGPREYKSRYRTSTGVDSVDVRWCMLWFSGQENTKTDIAHRLVSTRSMNQEVEDRDIGQPCGEQKLRDFRTPLLNKENEHTWVLTFGRFSTPSFTKTKMIQMNCEKSPKCEYSRMLILFVK